METTRTHTKTETTRNFEWLERDLLRHADLVDELAADLLDWDGTPERALGLIERGNELAARAEGFYRNELIGPNTKASFRNEASIGLGATNGHSPRGRGDLSYHLMYVLHENAKYGAPGELGGRPFNRSAVKSSSLRCHASSCRVIAQIASDVAAGKYLRIG